MRIYGNFSLKKYNAFQVETKCRYFTKVFSLKDLKLVNRFIRKNNLQYFIMGQGMNTLFTKNFNGIVVKINIKGIKLSRNLKEHFIIEVGAGEDWIKLVKYALANNWNGLENLSLIPGSVGAAPVQNIAAYGQNFEDVFYSLKAFDNKTLKMNVFRKKDCGFGYRTSYFKTKYNKRYIITSVKLILNKKPHINATYHSRYDSLISELLKTNKNQFTPKDAARAVIRIRKSKFPNWKLLGTAGSFFLNPVISKDKLAELQKVAPGVQFYPVDKLTYPKPDDPSFDHSKYVKVAAGWLLEELGWKGKRLGNVGTSPNQSLVVINYGVAGTDEILSFTQKMQESFYNQYKIRLQPEVNII